MAEMSTYLEDAVINFWLRNNPGALTAPATVYLALFNTDPTDAGNGTELSGNGYTRKAITFDAPSSGSTANSGAVTFDQATGAWSTINYIAIFDASSNGNMLFRGDVTTPKTLASGDQLVVNAGAITITLD